MGRRPGRWRSAISGARVSSLMIAVAVAGLLIGYASLLWRSGRREARLHAWIEAERVRAQGYHRLARLAIEQAPPADARVAALKGELDLETERFRSAAARLREGSR